MRLPSVPCHWFFLRFVVYDQFLPLCNLSFHLLSESFTEKNAFNYDEVQFVMFSFYGSGFWCQV